MTIAFTNLFFLCGLTSVYSLKCFERYKFLDPLINGPTDETKEVICPESTTSCGDALVSFQDPSGSPMKLNVKFCGGNSKSVSSGNNGVNETATRKNRAGKVADDPIVSATKDSVNDSNSLKIDLESDESLKSKSKDNNNNTNIVSSTEFCDGINATAAREGWSDVTCQETRCVNDLCNGLKCFQPADECVKNLTSNGPAEATLGNVAACATESRQCDMLDVSACVSAAIKTKTKTISIRDCHSKGEKTFCQRLLQRAGQFEVDCRETFCVTNGCNIPDVVVTGVIAIVFAVFLSVALIIIIVLVGRICCCEDSSSNDDRSRSNKNSNRATNSSITEKNKQKGKEKGKPSDVGKPKWAEKSYSAISLVRRFDMSRTRDQDYSDYEVSDFDS